VSLHLLKCWPDAFEAVCAGTKTAEWRRDDRGFEVGDELCLDEFIPPELGPKGGPPDGRFTGRHLSVRVTHILRAPKHGVPEGFVMLSIRRLPLPWTMRLRRYFFGGTKP